MAIRLLGLLESLHRDTPSGVTMWLVEIDHIIDGIYITIFVVSGSRAGLGVKKALRLQDLG